MQSDFAVFILTHGRPEKVITYKTLRDLNYTGKIYLLVDNLDKTVDKYIEKYGDDVIVFDKKDIASRTDLANNFNDLRSILCARNASFEIAQKLGIKYFLQLDDDYMSFNFRFNDKFDYVYEQVKNLDYIFSCVLKFYISSGALSVALSQNGDFMGGENSTFADYVTLKRKCMNSFFCSTERPFKFMGLINEDVNTYTTLGSRGGLFLTVNQVSLQQKQTQSNSGGMTDIYLDSGTYVKSFYTVMFHPSSVKVRTMSGRLHHAISWEKTVPMILREETRKVRV